MGFGSVFCIRGERNGRWLQAFFVVFIDIFEKFVGLDSARWFLVGFGCLAGDHTFGLHALKLDWICLGPCVYHSVKAAATSLEYGVLAGLFRYILSLVESLFFFCFRASLSLELLLKLRDLHPIYPLLLHSGCLHACYLDSLLLNFLFELVDLYTVLLLLLLEVLLMLFSQVRDVSLIIGYLYLQLFNLLHCLIQFLYLLVSLACHVLEHVG